MKFGELLVRENLINSAELEEALKMQVIFGGRLGTNMVEMGLIEESDIARVLSRKLRVPFAEPAELMEISPQVVSLIPKEIAERHKIMPLRLDGRRLTLAMINPADLKAIDEIAFRTGYIIRPVVAPELRLIEALEKYYRISRDLRYIAVTRTAPARRAPVPAATPAAAAAPAREVQPVSLTSADTVIDLEDIYEKIVEATKEEADLDAVARRLAEATSRQDIADLAIGWAGARFPRAALFLVRADGIQGWRAVVHRRPVDQFDRLRIALGEPSVLKTVAESRRLYIGSLPRSPYNSLMLQELGGEVPQTVLLLPLLMMGGVIAILYVDGQHAALQEGLTDLQKLAAKMAMAFEILVLKNKILIL